MNATLWPASARVVQAWVRLYTVGLSPEARYERREEIDADLWEQVYEASMLGPGQTKTATHVLVRWLLGIRDDVLWRLAQIRQKRTSDGKEGDMQQSAANNKALIITIASIALVLLAGSITTMVIEELEFYREVDVAPNLPGWPRFGIFVALGLSSIIGGFKVMRRLPGLGATLVIAGSFMAAAQVFWLIIPVVIALGLSTYAVMRARRTRG
jgi:hypothetical protein